MSAAIIVVALTKMDSVASSAGTKQPICAMRIVTPTCRMNVDLPPMFGPVITCTHTMLAEDLRRSEQSESRTEAVVVVQLCC